MKHMLSYGWRNHLITLQTYANQQLDQVFLAAMVPAAQLGQYTIAVTYASAGLSLGQAPALQMYSHFSRQENPDRAAYRHLLIRTMLLLTGICLVSAVLAPFFIPLVFGKSYEMSVAPALILILSAPLLSLGAMFSAIWKSAGKPLVAAKGQGIGLLLTVVTLPMPLSISASMAPRSSQSWSTVSWQRGCGGPGRSKGSAQHGRTRAYEDA